MVVVVDQEKGNILNDLTIQQLCKQALCQAQAGSDIISPSDMMDGRVSAIRETLDSEGYTDTSIMSYTSKFASSLYNPFRNALDSKLNFGDKQTYQQDPSNARESEIEASLDASEGADILMVKPGLPYLDILAKMRANTNLPLAIYHVSGEYAMIKAAKEKGYLNEKDTVLEIMKCFRRAGADAILTYYAKDIAKWMNEDITMDREFTEPSY